MAHLTKAIIACLVLSTGTADAFNIAECLANNTKAVCTRQMMIEEDNSKPLAAGQELTGESGKYTLTLQGDNWLRNGWDGQTDQAKDLGLVKDTGVGFLNVEVSSVPDADFEKTITDDMKSIYNGLLTGFRNGKIDIAKTSEMEILPLTISGANGQLGRFCYRALVKNAKPVCVYEGFIGRGAGESFRLLGSIGDYDDMRAEIENTITSFKFKE